MEDRTVEARGCRKTKRLLSGMEGKIVAYHVRLPSPPPFTLVLCSGLGRKVQYSSVTSFPSIKGETNSTNVKKFNLVMIIDHEYTLETMEDKPGTAI